MISVLKIKNKTGLRIKKETVNAGAHMIVMFDEVLQWPRHSEGNARAC